VAIGLTIVCMSETILNDIFSQFKVNAKVVGVRRGPSVNRYEVKLERGTKMSNVTSLSDDIVRIFGDENIQLVSPLEGGLIGIEVPRSDREMVEFGAIRDLGVLSAPLHTILGNDMDGNPVVADLSKMPHLLVAGATGSGKSVFINTMLCSVISRMSPQDVRLVLIDPKQVELSVYSKLPHLAYPLVTDAQQAGQALEYVVAEMTNRYELLSKFNVRNIAEYNDAVARGVIDGERLPMWLVVIDELADLMMVAKRDVEKSIVRITQLARAAGIHLVVATQRPSVDVITGLIKANMPSRLAFAVSSKTDSRVILDQMGAEVLTGMGDSLFVPQGSFKPQRIQGAYISTDEVEEIVSMWDNVSSEDDVPFSFRHFIAASKVRDLLGVVSVPIIERNLGVSTKEARKIVAKINKGMTEDEWDELEQERSRKSLMHRQLNKDLALNRDILSPQMIEQTEQILRDLVEEIEEMHVALEEHYGWDEED
jgi:DNA segregation ATPase FtsK/SpoIIIE, S-DNA-T family